MFGSRFSHENKQIFEASEITNDSNELQATPRQHFTNTH